MAFADSRGAHFGAGNQTGMEWSEKQGGMSISYEKTNVHDINLSDGQYREKVEEVVEEYEVPTVKVVIMATSFGQTFAKQIVEMGQNTHLVTSARGTLQHVTKPLLEVADVPVINYWMLALKQCPRLNPIKHKVYIVTNADNYDEFVAWAEDPKKSVGGFPVANIINNECSGRERLGILGDLDFFLKKDGPNQNILMIDCDYVLHPNFNLQRIIEHATIRGKCAVTMVNIQDENDRPYHSMIELDEETQDASNPKVAAIHYKPSSAKTDSKLAVAPVYYFRTDVLPKLMKWYSDNKGSDKPQNLLGKFLSHLPTLTPVYGLIVGHVFDIKTLPGFLYVDNLFDFYQKEKRRIASSHKVADTDSSLDLKTMYSGADVSKRLMHIADEATADNDVRRQLVDIGALDLDEMLVEFNDRYESFLAARLQGERDAVLPERFADASLTKHISRPQHAVYTTENNEYGRKGPSQQEMPMQWHGIQGLFSQQFPMREGRIQMFSNTGFVCNTTTSKVHKKFDEY